MSKDLLPQVLVDNIIKFCESIHSQKLEMISLQLQNRFGHEENIDIDKVTENISLFDSVVGLKSELSTNYRRNKHLRSQFKFIDPEPITIAIVDNVRYFYYYLPVTETLKRLLRDDTLRKFIINDVIVTSQQVC